MWPLVPTLPRKALIRLTSSKLCNIEVLGPSICDVVIKRIGLVVQPHRNVLPRHSIVARDAVHSDGEECVLATGRVEEGPLDSAVITLSVPHERQPGGARETGVDIGGAMRWSADGRACDVEFVARREDIFVSWGGM